MENSALAENRLDNKTVSNIALGSFAVAAVGAFTSLDPMIANLSILSLAIFIAIPTFLVCVYRFAKESVRGWIFWLALGGVVLFALRYFVENSLIGTLGDIGATVSLVIFFIAAVKIRKG